MKMPARPVRSSTKPNRFLDGAEHAGENQVHQKVKSKPPKKIVVFLPKNPSSGPADPKAVSRLFLMATTIIPLQRRRLSHHPSNLSQPSVGLRIKVRRRIRLMHLTNNAVLKKSTRTKPMQRRRNHHSHLSQPVGLRVKVSTRIGLMFMAQVEMTVNLLSFYSKIRC